jgi:hypothetical protein
MNQRYVPALGHAWLTGLYDPVMRTTMREATFKSRLIAPERRVAAVEDRRRRREGLPPVAEEVDHEFADGLQAQLLGLQRPRARARRSRRSKATAVRVYVTNKLDQPTTVHWHGLIVPCGMDGVGGLTQRSIEPGETFRYEWTFCAARHVHVPLASRRDDADGDGHARDDRRAPASPAGYRVDRDFVIMLSEWKLVVGTERPDPNEMTDFNVLTMNACCSRHRAAGVPQEGATRAHPLRQPQRDGPPSDPPARLLLQGDRRPTAARSRWPGAVAGDHGAGRGRAARARSSSSPTRRATGRCTAT